MEALTDFYMKNFQQPLPNLCIHEQNKIVLKRNLKLHRLFLATLNQYNNIPQTARLHQSPTYKHNAALLARYYGNDSESDDDSEQGEQNSGERQMNQGRERKEDGPPARSFQMMLEQYEENHARMSYDTTLHDIYNDESSSVSNIKKTEGLSSQEKLRNYMESDNLYEERKSLDGHYQGSSTSEEHQIFDKFRGNLQEFNLEDSDLDFDVAQKNGHINEPHKWENFDESLALSNHNGSFHRPSENLFGDDLLHSRAWMDLHADMNDEGQVNKSKQPVSLKNQNERRPTSEKENKISINLAIKEQNILIAPKNTEAVRKPKKQIVSELPLHMISLNTEESKPELTAKHPKTQVTYLSSHRGSEHKLLEKKPQFQSDRNLLKSESTGLMSTAAKEQNKRFENLKNEYLAQKMKSLKPSPVTTSQTENSPMKKITHKLPVQAQTHRQTSDQASAFDNASKKHSMSNAKKQENIRKFSRQDNDPSSTRNTKDNTKRSPHLSSELIDERTKQILDDFRKSGAFTRLSKDSSTGTTTTTSIPSTYKQLKERQSSTASNKINSIDIYTSSVKSTVNTSPNSNADINVKNRYSEGIKAYIKQERAPAIQETLATLRERAANSISKEIGAYTHGQRSSREIAQDLISHSKYRPSKERLVSNEGLSPSDLSAINYQMLSEAASLNSSKSNHESTIADRIYSSMSSKIQRTETVGSTSSNRLSTQPKEIYNNIVKKDYNGQITDRPPTAKVQLTSSKQQQKPMSSASAATLRRTESGLLNIGNKHSGPSLKLSSMSASLKLNLEKLGELKRKVNATNQIEKEENSYGFWSSRSTKAGNEDSSANKGYLSRDQEVTRHSIVKDHLDSHQRNIPKQNNNPELIDRTTKPKLLKTNHANTKSQSHLDLKYKESFLRNSMPQKHNNSPTLGEENHQISNFVQPKQQSFYPNNVKRLNSASSASSNYYNRKSTLEKEKKHF